MGIVCPVMLSSQEASLFLKTTTPASSPTGGNTSIGGYTLFYNTTGSGNTATGYQALFLNTSGSYNTANGKAALQFNTTGYGNTAIGGQTLNSNTTGFNNTATGINSLVRNTTGYNNTANGAAALGYNTTGNYNTSNGIGSLNLNTTGNNNTATGFNALVTNSTGSNNTALGTYADVTVGTLTNATAIGYNALVNASNKVRIGNTSVTVIEAAVNVSASSDARLKTNVKNSELGLEFIKKLRPVTYNFIEGHEGILYTGFIAQEVEQAAAQTSKLPFSGVVKPENSKDYYSLRYAEFTVPLVKAVQEQQKVIESLINRLNQLEQDNKTYHEGKQVPTTTSSVSKQDRGIELKQNTPNPSSNSTQIDYYIPQTAQNVVLSVFDMTGKCVHKHPIQAYGEGSMTIDTGSLTKGMYIYTLSINGQEAISKKMLISERQ